VPFLRVLGVLGQRLVNGLTHRFATGVARDRRSFRTRARGGLPRTGRPDPGPWLAGGSPRLRSRPCDRSLPVPLDAISSLQRDTPPTVRPTTSRSVPPPRRPLRIASGPRSQAPSQWGAPWAEQSRKGGRPPGLHSRKIPAFEDRCIPAGFVARPHRTAVGTPRACASPVGAHRPSRCPASSGTEPETPGGAFREGGQAQTCGCIASRATKRGVPSEDAER
jgi:hypothetical protein